jgi:hypothetical protein
MRRTNLIRLGVCLLFLASSAVAARAGFFLDAPVASVPPGFVGNTQFINPVLLVNSGSDGVVNFGVYARSVGDADWTDDFGAAVDAAIGGGVDGTASFVYFYQVVNSDPIPVLGAPDDALVQLDVFTPPGTVTSAGDVAGFVFSDLTAAGAGTGPAGNVRLGTAADVTAPPDDVFGDASPSEAGPFLSAAAPFVADGSALSPTSVTFLALQTQFDFAVPAGAYTSVLFFTSNFAPTHFIADLSDGGSTSGDIPSPLGPLTTTPTPEPGTWAMTIGALAIGLTAVFMNRRKAAAVA